MKVNYLIPANTKKSQLFFGKFNTFDLILVSSGIAVSLLLMIILDISDIKIALISLIPVAVTLFLVFSIPNYHNVLTVIKNIFIFYTTRQEFVWKGWCVTNGEDDSE